MMHSHSRCRVRDVDAFYELAIHYFEPGMEKKNVPFCGTTPSPILIDDLYMRWFLSHACLLSLSYLVHLVEGYVV